MTASLPADDRRPIATVAIIGNDALLAAAPATPVQLAHACLRRGFTVAVPVTWGDELLAAEAVRQLSSRARGPAVMCVCPFVRSRLLAPGPDLAPFLVSLVPPPVATARYLRTVYGDRGVHITYIGGCPGADDQTIDARLTPDTFLGELADHGISLAEQPLVFDSIVPPDRRRWCSLPGGVPSAEVLWSDTDTRTLVEIERDDVSTDLAQHIIARDHVLLDLAPSLGCSCSGSIPSLTPRSARVAVTALEPPRALGPVIEPPVVIPLDVPVSGATKAAEPPRPVETPAVVSQRTQQEIDHEARERALDMILGGDPEPPTVAPPPRRYTPPRADVRPPASPPAARPVEMRTTEAVSARGEQPMAAAMSQLVLETLIDDILIEPLIIPEAKPARAEVPPAPAPEPIVDRPPVQVETEVVVELDVVREVASEEPIGGIRHENGSSPALTTPPDPIEHPEPESEAEVDIDRVRLDPGALPDPSDVDASSEVETMVEMPTRSTPADVAPPFDDDENFVDEREPLDEDAMEDAASEIRRRTPPATPARHPSSAIPKAVAADGRPLPRAYVAKRRITPFANVAIPQSPQSLAPEPPSVVEPIASQSLGEPGVQPRMEVAASTASESLPEQSVASNAHPATVESPEPDPLVMQDESPAAPPQLEDDTPSTSESVWGVTVEAPIVSKPSITAPSQPGRPAPPATAPSDVPPETPAESRAGSVTAPAANGNTSITIMVIALVTLAVAVFFLLRR
jgi:hypothetical protein